jgi:Domain of unknown function (DUF4405)
MATVLDEATRRPPTRGAGPTCGGAGVSTRRLRAVTGIALLVTWGLATVTGVLLEITPQGPRAGQQTLLGLTQRTWGDLHWWVSVAAVTVTVAHLVLDWRTFRGCLRALTHRAPGGR